MMPFLIVVSKYCSWLMVSFTYPGKPGTALGPKCQIPSWFERLEKLIRLKEGRESESINETEEVDDLEGGGIASHGRLRINVAGFYEPI